MALSREERNARQCERRRVHPESFQAAQKKWRDANLEKARELNRMRMRVWRDAHRDKVRESNRLWRQRHREQVNAINRVWYHAHLEQSRARYHARHAAEPEKERARGRKRYATDPEKTVARSRKRYAIKKGVVHRPYTTAEIYKRDKGICGLCHKRVKEEEMSVDHILPIQPYRGADAPYNIQLAHLRCNQSKGNIGHLPSQLRLDLL